MLSLSKHESDFFSSLLEWTRKRWPDAAAEFFITPAAIAEEVWHVAHQERCAWSFNVELRPFGETW